MFISFELSSLAQEYLVHSLQWRNSSWFSLLVPLSAALGALIAAGLRLAPPVAPLRAHMAVGVTLWLSFHLTSLAPLYMSYPGFLAGKAAKMLPTMAVGSVWLRKRYQPLDWVAAALAAGGLAIALIGDHSASHQHDGSDATQQHNATMPSASASSSAGGISPTGIGIMLAALLLDGIASNAQEALFSQYSVPPSEIAIYAMGTAGLLATTYSATTGNLMDGIASLQSDSRVAGALLVYALASYMSNVAILGMISWSGAASTMFTSAVCKALMISVSYFIFPKPVAIQQVAGMALVLLSVGMAAYSRGRHAAVPEAMPPQPSSPTAAEIAAGAEEEEQQQEEMASESAEAEQAEGASGDAAAAEAAAIAADDAGDAAGSLLEPAASTAVEASVGADDIAENENENSDGNSQSEQQQQMLHSSGTTTALAAPRTSMASSSAVSGGGLRRRHGNTGLALSTAAANAAASTLDDHQQQHQDSGGGTRPTKSPFTPSRAAAGSARYLTPKVGSVVMANPPNSTTSAASSNALDRAEAGGSSGGGVAGRARGASAAADTASSVAPSATAAPAASGFNVPTTFRLVRTQSSKALSVVTDLVGLSRPPPSHDVLSPIGIIAGDRTSSLLTPRVGGATSSSLAPVAEGVRQQQQQHHQQQPTSSRYRVVGLEADAWQHRRGLTYADTLSSSLTGRASGLSSGVAMLQQHRHARRTMSTAAAAGSGVAASGVRTPKAVQVPISAAAAVLRRQRTENDASTFFEPSSGRVAEQVDGGAAGRPPVPRQPQASRPLLMRGNTLPASSLRRHQMLASTEQRVAHADTDGGNELVGLRDAVSSMVSAAATVPGSTHSTPARPPPAVSLLPPAPALGTDNPAFTHIYLATQSAPVSPLESNLIFSKVSGREQAVRRSMLVQLGASAGLAPEGASEVQPVEERPSEEGEDDAGGDDDS